MSQNGQLHIKNLAASAVRFLKYVWPYWDNSKGVNIINGQNLLDYLLLTLIKFLNSIWFFLGAFVLFIYLFSISMQDNSSITKFCCHCVLCKYFMLDTSIISIYFMAMFPFYTFWKYQKTRRLPMFPRSIERDR